MHACPHVALLPLQVSDVHELPSSVQVIPAAWKTSTHELLVPVQWSAASLSHAPPCEAPPQPVDTDANAFAGHAADVPVQVSATSQGPADTRHTVDDDAKAFAGQFAPVPVQFSATSQGPADARQTVADDAKPSAGQFAPVPVQFSATSHGPAEARHTVDDDAKPAVGPGALAAPLQFSGTSQGPAPARHTVLLGCTVFVAQ